MNRKLNTTIRKVIAAVAAASALSVGRATQLIDPLWLLIVMSIGSIVAIGSHGQTVRHRPRADPPFTLQLGDPASIAEATGNGALVHVVKMLWDERVGPLYQQLEHHYDSPELWTAAMSEHRSVLKAIAGRDPAGARAAMQRHLNQAYKRFSKGWDTLQ